MWQHTLNTQAEIRGKSCITFLVTQQKLWDEPAVAGEGLSLALTALATNLPFQPQADFRQRKCYF